MSSAFRRRSSGGAAATAARIVIVGGGFAGLEAAKQLGKAGLAVTVIDRHNHHLFQPLLYQVATAALSAPDVAEPIRKVLRGFESVQVLLAEAAGIDPASNLVRLSDGDSIGYDFLVLAPGATHGYFGHDDWARHAPGLKSLTDARHIRTRALLAFEMAEKASDPAEQQRLMTFAVIGGGPTGVELAGSLAELSRYTLARDFRNVRPETARIMLIEAGPRILPAFCEELSLYAAARLRKLGVEVLVGTAVEEMGSDWIRFSGRTEPVNVVLWAAGVAASPMGRQLGGQLGVETDRAGRVTVGRTLLVAGSSNIFALGDVASFIGKDGKPLPGLAQVAKQQGRHLGRSLARHLKGGAALKPFDYRGRGNTAIIGRHAAVFEQGRFRMKGWVAWLAWAFIHVYLLVGFQHRVQVSLQWLWRYLTYERGARLVTEDALREDRKVGN